MKQNPVFTIYSDDTMLILIEMAGCIGCSNKTVTTIIIYNNYLKLKKMGTKKEVPEQIEFSFLGIFKQKSINPGKESLKHLKEVIGFSKWVMAFIAILAGIIIAVKILWPQVDVKNILVYSGVTTVIGKVTKIWPLSKNNHSP